MRGELSSGRHSKRHPYDWYVDDYWVGSQLAQQLGWFEYERETGLAVWDPSCGFGNTLQSIHGTVPIWLSDIVNHVKWALYPENYAPRPTYFDADFLECEVAPAPCSIVCNPPYSYKKGILEAFVRHALKLATGRVCMVVPNKWLASQSRFRLFAIDHPPAEILHLTQRPSMPPGDRIALMGNRAFNGGMIDYCWIVWDAQHPTAPGETRTLWLPPLLAGVELPAPVSLTDATPASALEEM